MSRLRRRSVAGTVWLVALLALGCGDPRNDPKPEPRTTTPRTSASASAAPPPPKGSPFAERAIQSLEIAKLNERERAELMAGLDKAIAPCPDTPVSVAQCIDEKRACKLCKPAGEFLARSVRGGLVSTELQGLYDVRFDPKSVAKLEIGDSPMKGPKDAPVTIVEWADFQCPHCALMRLILEMLSERFPGQVRIVYKYYQLPGHDRAFAAAMTAQAAHKQGKFWEMQALLFGDPTTGQMPGLSDNDLAAYARAVGLEMDSYKQDIASEETKSFLEADIKAADALGLDGTPMVFINGRKMPLEKLKPFVEELEEWLKLEIEQAGQVPTQPTKRYHELRKVLGVDEDEPGPAPTPGGSASAIPSAGPSAAPSAGPSAGASAGAPAPSGSASAATPSAVPSASAGPPKKKPKE